MNKRDPFWLDPNELQTINRLIMQELDKERLPILFAIQSELSVAKIRFENGRYKDVLAVVLGMKDMIPVRLSSQEKDYLLTLDIPSTVKERLS